MGRHSQFRHPQAPYRCARAARDGRAHHSRRDRQPDRSAGAAPLVRPNIILILTDDQTMESVARMPYVSSRTDWISFDQAYINNSLCCPSRATILTGQYDTQNGVTTNAAGQLLDERETLPVWLRSGRLPDRLVRQVPQLRTRSAAACTCRPVGPSGRPPTRAGPQWQMYPQYHWKLNDNGVSRSRS